MPDRAQCSNAEGNVTGTRAGGAVSLLLNSVVLQYPLRVSAALDGSSLRGTVSAKNYPPHTFLADR